MWRMLLTMFLLGATAVAPAWALDSPKDDPVNVAKEDAAPQAMLHQMEVWLAPQEHAMVVQDRMTLPARWSGDGDGELLLRLALQATVTRVVYAAPGTPEIELEFSKEITKLRVVLPNDAEGGEVSLSYRCVFNTPVEEAPANMDNPGFGVEGAIQPQGAMLLAGSGWHPISGAPGGDQYEIVIRAPKGMYAVTTGELVGFTDAVPPSFSPADPERPAALRETGEADQSEAPEEGLESVSTWRNLSPQGPLPLAAGWWTIQEASAGGVRVITCFGEENAPLAQQYLEASSRWLALYAALHGPYAFKQFMVVENFLPTGYGFPGFTLLGKRVIRLPFIPHTSLRHEIAHCWWGNGVFVDYSQGNWCEGLATYVADYLGQEEQSPEAAADYRLRVLRQYALLAAGEEDFPLARFASRMSPATQAVGYGKGMYVFHMIRQRLGDAAFWGALRAVYKEKLFQQAGWEDLRQAFVTHGRWDVEESRQFMRQWLDRAGAPVLSLKDVTQQQGPGGWQLDGLLHQERPYYRLNVPMEMTVQGEAAPPVKGPEVPVQGVTPFFLTDMPAPLAAVRFDPQAHVFRLLAPEEIPATTDSLKGSSSLTAILAKGMSQAQRGFLERGLEGLSQGRTRIVEEASLQEADLHALKGRDVFFFGQPSTPMAEELLGMSAQLAQWGVTVDAQGFAWPNHPDAAGADVLFLVHGAGEHRGARALLAAKAEAPADALARPMALLTHYGRYSYLAFANGHAVLKGTWPPGDGPLVHRFQRNTGSLAPPVRLEGTGQ